MTGFVKGRTRFRVWPFLFDNPLGKFSKAFTGVVLRTCQECRQQFEQTPGEKNIRCHACRERRRHKKCRKCSEAYYDESLKNTRRHCAPCGQKKTPGRALKVTERTERRRARRVRKGEGGRMDRFETLKPYTTTWWGRVGELLFKHLYPHAGDAVVEYGNKAPFDLYHIDLGVVDVKTAKARTSTHGLSKWAYQVEGLSQACDYGFFLGFNVAQDCLEYAWLVPSSSVPGKGKNFSPSSREYADSAFELLPAEVRLLNRKFQALLLSVHEPPPEKPDAVGVEYERTVLGKLGEAIYRVWHPSSDHAAAHNPVETFDFQDSDGVTVNVKVRRPSTGHRKERWTFFRSQGCTSEDYFCIAVDRHVTQVLGVWRLPSASMPTHGFSVRLEGVSKYDKFKAYEHVVPCRVGDVVNVSDLDAIHLQITGLTRSLIDGMSEGEQGVLLHRAAAYHRILGFPYPSIPSDKTVAKEVARLQGYAPPGSLLTRENAGLRTCSAYMPHRFDSRNADADLSAHSAFKDDKRLLKALRFCLRGKSPGLRSRNLRSALTALNRTPVNFRPAVAKHLISKYCPEGGSVLDPCAGWGGRLMGALAAGRSYTGIDADPRTARALYSLGLRLCNVMGKPRDCYAILSDRVENLSPEEGKHDFAISSPPFWAKEVYTEGVPYPPFPEWRETMLRPLMQFVFTSLKPWA